MIKKYVGCYLSADYVFKSHLFFLKWVILFLSDGKILSSIAFHNPSDWPQDQYSFPTAISVH
jgi:hypothetical protein